MRKRRPKPPPTPTEQRQTQLIPGCTKVSPGCANCYAEKLNKHYQWAPGWGPNHKRRITSASNWSEPLRWAKKARAAGKPGKVFCASLADIFDHEAPIEARRALGRSFAQPRTSSLNQPYGPALSLLPSPGTFRSFALKKGKPDADRGMSKSPAYRSLCPFNRPGLPSASRGGRAKHVRDRRNCHCLCGGIVRVPV